MVFSCRGLVGIISAGIGASLVTGPEMELDSTVLTFVVGGTKWEKTGENSVGQGCKKGRERGREGGRGKGVKNTQGKICTRWDMVLHS